MIGGDSILPGQTRGLSPLFTNPIPQGSGLGAAVEPFFERGIGSMAGTNNLSFRERSFRSVFGPKRVTEPAAATSRTVARDEDRGLSAPCTTMPRDLTGIADICDVGKS